MIGASYGRIKVRQSTHGWETNVSLNIKNEETCRLASELAQLTGETMTGAITVALRERLEREKRERDAEALIQEMKDIAGRLAVLPPYTPPYGAPLPTDFSSTDHGDLLYDERGLPK